MFSRNLINSIISLFSLLGVLQNACLFKNFEGRKQLMMDCSIQSMFSVQVKPDAFNLNGLA